jgi:hypothetical protein
MLNAAALLGFGGISLFAVTTTVWFSRAKHVAIPDSRLAFLLGWASAGFLGAASFASPGAGWFTGIFGGLALVGCLLMLGLYALGKQKTGSAILVGDVVPTFEAVDDQGRTYTSDALIGTPTLIKFFRGHW